MWELGPYVVILSFPTPHFDSLNPIFLWMNVQLLSSILWARLYVDRVWFKEGEPTTFKVFVGQNLLAAAFNLIEFAKDADDLDGAVFVCVIQSSTVVKAGYLLGSRKTINDNHWWQHYNNYPKLNNMDVEVKPHSIKDLNNGPWDPKNNIHAAHILCSVEDKKGVNKQTISLYKKTCKKFVRRKTSRKDAHSNTSLLIKRIRLPLPPIINPNWLK